MKKQIIVHKKAQKELNKVPAEVLARIDARLNFLLEDGKLSKPFGKKIDTNLFEIRIRHKGQWRAIYAYMWKNTVIVLAVFQKKTQKTPLKELQKSKNRLRKLS